MIYKPEELLVKRINLSNQINTFLNPCEGFKPSQGYLKINPRSGQIAFKRLPVTKNLTKFPNYSFSEK
jgi:hypothetical protein